MTDVRGTYQLVGSDEEDERAKASTDLSDFGSEKPGQGLAFGKVTSVNSTQTKGSALTRFGATHSVNSTDTSSSTAKAALITKLQTGGTSVKRIVSTSSSITGGHMEYMGHNILRDEGKWQFVIMLPLIPPNKEVDKKWDEYLSPETVQERLRTYFPRFVFQNVDGEFDYLQLQSTFGVGASMEEEEYDPDEKVIPDLSFDTRSFSGMLNGSSADDKKIDEEAPDEGEQHTGMTRRDFHEAVRQTIVMLLAGPHLGLKLQASETVDRDELFLKLELPPGEPVWSSSHGRWIPGRTKRYNTQEQLADAMDLRMPLLHSAYPASTPCPTEDLDSRRNFKGKDYVPAVLPYNKTNRKFFAPFSELDLLRLARMRVNQFLVFEELMKDEIIIPDGFFAVHSWKEIQRFRKHPDTAPSGATSWAEGWCHWRSMFRYPGDEHIDHVRNYFGEEVAFFFHWMNFFSRFLIVPALVGLALTFSRIFTFLPVMGPTFTLIEEYLTIAFLVVMVMWSASFGEMYRRHMQIPIEKWGMRNYKAIDTNLASFRKELVGSKRDTFIRIFHWLLVGLVLLWTIGVNFLITAWRMYLLHGGSSLQGSGIAANVGKYLVSVNIQLVDLIWSTISPKITNMENHRTKRERQEARTTKLFVVKIFVYYWPFWYIAFLQPTVEPGTTYVECLEYLQESLAVFMFIHILFVVLYTVIPMVKAYRSIQQELTDTGSEHYTYLQAQAKLPAEKDLDDDFLELIISLGIVMQFSAFMPIIPAVQYMSNMLEMTLLAYQMLMGYRRNPAHGMEGIGVWESIIYYVSCLAVIVNVGLGVFFQEPVSTWPPQQQLMTFIIAEHALFGAKCLVELAIPDSDMVTFMVQTTNDAVKHKLFSRHAGKPVLVKGPRHMPNTALIVEDRDLPPGMVSADGSSTVAPVRDRSTTLLRVRASQGKETNACIRSMQGMPNIGSLLGMS
mmetsp:Transcript_63091/g.150388  ORF Transcript_63091/g.150388 Transcript_63091/m.150388 type:complete len:954 (-) Transcript_63091:217-3078(-)